MATSIVDRIIAVLDSRLRNITVDNGYDFDVASVMPVSRDTNAYAPQPLAIVYRWENETENDELMCPGNPAAIAYDVAIQIDGYSRQLDEDGHQIETEDRTVTENTMVTAIKKAIVNNDASGWQTFGGNAMNATIAASEEMQAPGFDGARVALLVTYRASETDPSENR